MDFNEGQDDISRIISYLNSELAKLRTGKANPDMLDSVYVTVYESQMPIKHIASVSVSDPRTIVVQPWDSANVKAIETALIASDLGLNPSVDGEIIRISVPDLTQERREQLMKQTRDKIEEARIAVRQVRQKLLSSLDDQLSEGGVSEDDIQRQKNDVEKFIEKTMEDLDHVAETKEGELSNV